MANQYTTRAMRTATNALGATLTKTTKPKTAKRKYVKGGIKHDPSAQRFAMSYSAVRRTILNEKNPNVRRALFATIFPKLSDKQLDLCSQYPFEVAFSGAQLILPSSWNNL